MAPDGFTVLERDHDALLARLRQVAPAGRGAERQRLFERLLVELPEHFRVEREILQRTLGGAREPGPAAEAWRRIAGAEAEVRRLLGEMEGGIESHGVRFDDTFPRLVEVVENHAHETQERLFPLVRGSVPAADLEEAAAELERRRREEPSEGGGMAVADLGEAPSRGR